MNLRLELRKSKNIMVRTTEAPAGPAKKTKKPPKRKPNVEEDAEPAAQPPKKKGRGQK